MEKLKNIFKDKNKKTENLVVFLVILVITLIIMNSIIKEDDTKKEKEHSGTELVSSGIRNQEISTDLEKRLEAILSKIDGVGEVSVLVTYSQSNTIIPMYNESMSKSVTEETDTSGGVRTIQSEDAEKSVVTGSDSNPVTRKNGFSYC